MDIIAQQEQIIAKRLQRLDGKQSKDTRDNAFLSAGHEILPMLEYFGHDLQTASRTMSQAVFLCDATLTDPRHSKLTGLSGLPLFFARVGEQTLASIKAFPSTSPSYARALWAQQHLFRMVPNIPRLLHVGRACHQHEDYFLLATQFIDGHVVNDLIFTMSALPHNEERSRARKLLEHIVFKIGILHGRIHTAGTHCFGSQNSLVKYNHERILYHASAGFKRAPHLAIDSNRLVSSVSAIMSAMDHHDYRHAFLHGDAHPGNYIYDEKTDVVYALDLDSGAHSIGAMNTPLCSPFTDYVKFVASMKVREIFGVTADESAILRHAFDQGYLAGGGIPPSTTTEQFYTVMEVLDYAHWYFYHEAKLAYEAKIVMQRILHTGIQWLKAICQL